MQKMKLHLYTKTQKKTKHAANPLVEFLNTFNISIARMQLKEDDTNKVFSLCVDMVKNMRKLNLSLMTEDNKLSPEVALDVTTDLVCDKLSSLDSKYKRKKDFELNEFYVPPKEVAIGTRWEIKKVKSCKTKKIISLPRRIQCTFQYVSIVDTLRSLFRSDDFRNMYLEYNANKDHVCENGKFRDFCCTKTYQQSKLFRNNPNALQIQLASDDFEICNPLQSIAIESESSQNLQHLLHNSKFAKEIPLEAKQHISRLFV